MTLIHAGKQTNSRIRISPFKAIVASKFDGDFTGLHILAYQAFGVCWRVSGGLDEITRDDAFASPIAQDVLVFNQGLLYPVLKAAACMPSRNGEWFQWWLIGLSS